MTVDRKLLTVQIVGMFVVFALALFLAAGTSGGSPIPLAPVGLASTSAISTCAWMISGTSATVSILYSSMLALTTMQLAASTTRSSVSAKPIPCVTAPITWLSTIVGFTIRPQSCAATTRRTVTSPLSTSTSSRIRS